VPPDGRSASLYSFNMNANWFQKERLDYGRKSDTPTAYSRKPFGEKGLRFLSFFSGIAFIILAFKLLL